jgi:hemolysin III
MIRSGPNAEISPPVERVADGVVQGVNVVLATVGCVALAVWAYSHTTPLQGVALAVYGFGLLAMVVCSALYAWGRGGRWHSLYRHLDHAAIFVMIAGTYTPFTVSGFAEGHGIRLLATVWSIALVDVLLKLFAPARFDPLSVPLYLLMGWAVLSDPGLLWVLPTGVIVPLVAGGVLYSVGVVFHLAPVRFQEAIWHGFVLAAAACHYLAVVQAVA